MKLITHSELQRYRRGILGMGAYFVSHLTGRMFTYSCYK